LFRDTEFFGKMDPFVKINYMGQKFKTKVHNSGGKNPIWNETIDFRPSGMDTDIEFVVLDEDLTTDDFIGSCIVKVRPLVQNNGVREWFTLMYKSKSAGQIYIETTFKPEGGSELPKVPQVQQQQVIYQQPVIQAQAPQMYMQMQQAVPQMMQQPMYM